MTSHWADGKPVSDPPAPLLRVFSTKLPAKILPKPIDLMHPFVEDRHDTDVPVGQPAPIDIVPPVTKQVTLDAERCRNGSRCHAVGFDAIEGSKQIGDVAIGPPDSPAIPRVAIDLVQAIGGRLLDTDLCHGIQALLRAIT